MAIAAPNSHENAHKSNYTFNAFMNVALNMELARATFNRTQLLALLNVPHCPSNLVPKFLLLYLGHWKRCRISWSTCDCHCHKARPTPQGPYLLGVQHSSYWAL